MPSNEADSFAILLCYRSYYRYIMEHNLTYHIFLWCDEEWGVSRDCLVSLQCVNHQLQLSQTIYWYHIVSVIHIYLRHLTTLLRIEHIVTRLIGHLQECLTIESKWQRHCIVNTRIKGMFNRYIQCLTVNQQKQIFGSIDSPLTQIYSTSIFRMRVSLVSFIQTYFHPSNPNMSTI